MSNFPYNHHEYKHSDSVNGSPLNYEQASKLADDVLMWHSDIDTDDWTQSNDGHEDDVQNMAMGLIELFSDPGAVRRIIMTGESVKNSVRTLMEIEKIEGISQSTRSAIAVVKDIFGKPTETTP